jgi:hypothetical protein
LPRLLHSLVRKKIIILTRKEKGQDDAKSSNFGFAISHQHAG